MVAGISVLVVVKPWRGDPAEPAEPRSDARGRARRSPSPRRPAAQAAQSGQSGQPGQPGQVAMTATPPLNPNSTTATMPATMPAAAPALAKLPDLSKRYAPTADRPKPQPRTARVEATPVRRHRVETINRGRRVPSEPGREEIFLPDWLGPVTSGQRVLS